MPEITAASKAWCSIAEAATYLDVHQATIRRMIASKKIEAMRLGNRAIRVRIASLESAGTRMGA
ncbi:helix-turn-helix domain-containing protein [Rhodococcus pyridinivorans]|uniref:helix-turn-helix domain-containing protein n=1 Tax=Rhodococcus pyridinivorans TaxID=103816 RepID=UPI0036AFBC4E